MMGNYFFCNQGGVVTRIIRMAYKSQFKTLALDQFYKDNRN